MFRSSSSVSLSSGRNRHSRQNSPMKSSSSLLGTIKGIVSKPLTWLTSNGNFEDLGKRSRVEAQESSDEEDDGQRTKRMRVDSPDRSTMGYLDPPLESLEPARSRPSPMHLDASRDFHEHSVENFRSSIYGTRAPILSSARTMSIDPPSRYASVYRDSTMIPLPVDSPRESRFSMGLRDVSMQPRTSPFKPRPSNPSQSDLITSVRREVSAPPPVANLMSKPMFVKPPQGERVSRKLEEQQTMSLGTFTEFNRETRSPSRDRMLTSFNTIPSQVPDSSFYAPKQSIAEKTFHELEMYKTPIMPSRLRGMKTIPKFLKPKRAHVPIPMTGHNRDSKSSLGLISQHKEKAKDEGKPYAGRSGLNKLLAKRKAEEEEERAEQGLDESAEEHANKRDIGVSTAFPLDSTYEQSKSMNVSNSLSSFSQDPFKPLNRDRHQPYGRVGRTRKRESGFTSVPLRNGRNTANKFSAAFDEDDSIDDQAIVDDDVGKTAETQPKKPTFEAPANFTFAKADATIQHDHSAAKEPPIAFLPFSFAKTASVDTTTKALQNTPTVVNDTEKSNGFALLPTIAPPKAEVDKLSVPPISNQAEAVPPKVAIVPPTPDQSASTAKNETVEQSNEPSVTNASQPANFAKSTTSTPNFFANSALLAGYKPSIPSGLATVSTISDLPASSAPTKDTENPLWDGEAAQTVAPVPTIERTRSPKPLPFGSVNRPSTWGQTSSGLSGSQGLSVFNDVSKQSETSTTNSSGSTNTLFGTPATLPAIAPPVNQTPSQSLMSIFSTPAPKATETDANSTESDNKPAAASVSTPSTAFPSFGTSNTALPSPVKGDAPKPLFGLGNVTVSATKSGSDSSGNMQKSPFTFGALPALTNNTSTSDSNLPKSVFGTTSGSGFSFGTPPVQNTDKVSEDSDSKNMFTFDAAPVTPPLGAESKASFLAFSSTNATDTGFNTSTPVKAGEPTPSVAPPLFTFNTPVRPTTPPTKADDSLTRMDESPTRMDTNGTEKASTEAKLPSLTFGSAATPNPFGQPSGGMFMFGQPAPPAGGVALNPFAAKLDEKSSGGFTFGARASSAPVVSTSFSFGKPDDSTPPATAFGATSNPFGQPTSTVTTSSPFTFGAATTTTPQSNPFAASSMTSGSPFQQSVPFSFGAPSVTTNSPFNFGGSQPASPATSTTGLPQSPATTTPQFTFGQSNGSSGSTLFNIGAAPPSTANANGRPTKRLPRRGPPPKR